MPKVSVVIPTHNRADLLGRAVRSALAQTHGDLEVLITDDASSDGTGEMVARIGDARVKYFRHDTARGVSAARNTAMTNATGEFIAFLDDDDEWLPEKLRIQLDRFAQLSSSVGLICSGHLEVDSVANQVVSEVIPAERGWVFERLLRRGSFNHTSTILVRSECFAEVGLFDITFVYAEDLDMWLRIAQKYEFDFVTMPLTRLYFQRDGLSRNYDAMISGVEAHLDKYRDFFQDNPAAFTERLQKLASFYCIAGNARRGRRIFCQAIANRPLAVKSYLGVALSMMGPRMFRICCGAGIWTEARRLLGYR